MVGSKRTGKIILLYVITSLLLLVMVYPYIHMVVQSLAPWDEVDRKVIPSSLTFKSYTWLFTGGETGQARPWFRAFLNSLLVSTASTMLMMITAVMAGYALSKYVFKGKHFINQVILFQMFFPAVILLIPQFLLIRQLGWYDTYWAMIIPKSVSLWAIFLYVNFFKAIPDEIIEAAKIDGAREVRIIWNIILPMSRSITSIIFLFLFMERWVELLWDMLVVRTETMLTLNVLLAQMFGPYESYPGGMYAGSVLLTVPIIILFIFFSKNFKEGIQFALK